MQASRNTSAQPLTRHYLTVTPICLACLLATGGSQVAVALPEGAKVTQGTAQITQPAGNKMEIRQGTDRASIDWNSFSIGTNESLRVLQPSSSSVLVNRVTGSDPSQIFGRLDANGRVFLTNPRGIVFGRDAQVDVGGLLATTMSITADPFNPGRYALSGGDTQPGEIVVDGQIRSSGTVAFAGPQISLNGVIDAKRIAAAAANQVQIDVDGDGLVFFNPRNDEGLQARLKVLGRLQADGGVVDLRAAARAGIADTVLNVDGIVQAKSVGAVVGQVVVDGGSQGGVLISGQINVSGAQAGERGGSVQVYGEGVGLVGQGRIDASGAAGGGTVLFGGDYLGSGAHETARRAFVGEDASITASATGKGDGGKVIVWSEEATRFFGQATADATAAGGNGGFIEVSGKDYLDFRGQFSALAPAGRAGSLLLDPDTVNISNAANANLAGGNSNPTQPFESSNNNTANLSWATIGNALNGGNVIVRSTGAGANAGSVNVTANSDAIAGTVSFSANRTLTFNSVSDISVGGNIRNEGSGALDVFFNAPSGAITHSAGTITARDLTTTSSGATTLGPLSLSRDLSVTSGGDIAQSGAWSVTGGASLRIDTNTNRDILLATRDNNIAGAVTVSSVGGGSVRDFGLRNVNATASVPTLPASLRDLDLQLTNTSLQLPALTLTRDLNVEAGGAITQAAGTLSVAGATTLTSNTATINVTLANANNELNGVTLLGANGGKFGAVSLNDKDTGANGLSVGGTGTTAADTDLTVTAGGVLGFTGGSLKSLSVTARGAVGQSAPITVAGLTSVTAESATINVGLASGNNELNGVALLSSGGGKFGTVTVNDKDTAANGLSVGGAGTTAADTDLTVTAGGALAFSGGSLKSLDATAKSDITQTGALVVANAAAFKMDTGTGKDILLASQNNDFQGTVTVTTPNGGTLRDFGFKSINAGATAPTLPAVTLRNLDLRLTNAAVLVPAVTLTGALNVEAGGAITQAAGTLSVAGTTTLTANTATINATLANANNELNGVALLSSGGGKFGTVTVNDKDTAANGLSVGGAGTTAADTDLTVTAGGALAFSGGSLKSLDATAKSDITQTGALVVANAAAFKMDTGTGKDILLASQNNDFQGTVTVATPNGGTLRDFGFKSINAGATAPTLPAVTLRNLDLRLTNAAVLVPAVTLTGALNVEAGGAITQAAGTLSVAGTTTLTANTATINATLANANNELNGVTLLSTGGGKFGTVTVNDKDTAANGLSVGGAGTTAADTDLTVTAGGALAFSGGSLKSLDATAKSDITQTGALVVANAAAFKMDTGTGKDILLASQNNDFQGTVTVTTPNGGTLRDFGFKSINAGATAPTLPASTLRNLDLRLTNAAVALPAVTLTGALNVEAGGAITSGALSVAGTTTLTANTATINATLANANNELNGVTLLSSGGGKFGTVSLNDKDTAANGLSVGGAGTTAADTDLTVTAGGALAFSGGSLKSLDATAKGAISQTAALTVANAASLTADTNTLTVALNDANNELKSVSLLASGGGQFSTVTLRDKDTAADGLSVGGAGTTTASTDLTLTAGGTLAFTGGSLKSLAATAKGDVSQTGALTVANTSTLTADTNLIAVTLGNANNEFGSVALLRTGGGRFGAVALTDKDAATNGLTVGGTGTTAADTDLVVNAGGALTLSGGSLKTLAVTAKDSIDQTGALTVAGTAGFTMDTGVGKDIQLASQNNNVQGAVTFATTNGATLRDLAFKNVSATAPGPVWSSTPGRNFEIRLPAAAVQLPAAVLTGNLTVEAAGAITQAAGVLSVAGTTALTANGSTISAVLNNVGNEFGSVQLLGSSGGRFGTVTLNDADVASNGLSVGGSGTTTANTDLTLTAGGALTFTGGSLKSLAATAKGAVGQTGALTVATTASLTADTNTLNVVLSNANNELNSVSLLSANGGKFATVTLTDKDTAANGLAVGGAGTTAADTDLTVGTGGALAFSGGSQKSLTATARSHITQTGALVVANATSLTLDTGTDKDILLAGQSNDFQGPFTVATVNGATLRDFGFRSINAGGSAPSLPGGVLRNLDLRLTGAVQLPAVTLTGTLNVEAGGAITQAAGTLSVAGATTLTSTAGTINVTLNGANDEFGGVTLASTGGGKFGTVTLNDKDTAANGLSVGGTGTTSADTDLTVNTGGALTLTGGSLKSLAATAKGAIGQTGALTVAQGSSLTADTQTITVALSDANNELNGVSLLASGGGRFAGVTLRDKDTAANGLSVGGAGTTAANTDLVVATGGALDFTGGSLKSLGATAKGAITQSGALTVANAAQLTADTNTLGVALNHANNEFKSVTLVSTAGGKFGVVGVNDRDTAADGLSLGLAATTLADTDLTVVAGGALGVSGANLKTFTATARDHITQTGALTVSGAAAFTIDTATNKDILLAGQDNDFRSTVSFAATNGGSIRDLGLRSINAGASVPTLPATLRNLDLQFTATGVDLPGSTLSGALNVVAGGAVTQSGALVVGGTTTINAGSSAVTLTQAGNDFSGNVAVTTTGAASVRDATALDVSFTGTGQTTAQAGGALTAALSGTGATSLTGGSVASSGTSGVLTLASAGTTDLGTSTVTGNLGITSAGAVTQSGAVAVTGTTNVSAGAASVTLANAGNDFQGAVTVANTGLASVRDANALTASFTGSSGATAQAGAALVASFTNTGGATALAAGTLDATLSNSGTTALTGGGVASRGSSGGLTISSTGTTTLGASTVGGSLGVVGTGDVTQTGDLTVAGSTTVDAGAAAVTLARAGNDFQQAVSVTTTGAASVRDANALGVSFTNTSGATAQAGGALTATLSNSGATDLTGAGVTSSGSSGALGISSTGATSLGASTVTGGLTLGSTGAVTQSGDVTVTGTTAINAQAAAVTLANAGNDFQQAVSVTTTGAASVRDANALGVSFNGTGVTTAQAGQALTATLTGAGATSLTGAGVTSSGSSAGLAITSSATTSLGTSSVGGSLSVNGQGAIGQTGDVTVSGTTSLAAGAGDVTLARAGNDFQQAVSVTTTGAASVRDANALGVSFTNTSGATAQAGGALTATLSNSGATDLTGAGVTSSGSSGALGISSTGATSLGASTVTGGLTLGSTGAVTQSGDVTVTGTTAINAQAAAVTLANAGNDFQQAVSVTTTGAASVRDANALGVSFNGTGVTTAQAGQALTATLTGAGATSLTGAGVTSSGSSAGLAITSSATTSLGTSSVGGSLSVNGQGAIGQTGDVTVSGTTSLAAGAGDVTLARAGNDFQQAVSVTTTGAASVRDANALGVSFTNTSGATAQAGGALTATLSNSGATDLTGAGVTSSGSSGALGISSTGATSLGASTVTGGLTLGSTGAVTQSGDVTVTGTTAINAQAAAVTLANAGNDFQQAVSVTTTGAASVRDANALGVSFNGTGVTTAQAGQALTATLTGAGATSLTGAGVTSSGSSAALSVASTGPTLLGASTVTGSLSLDSTGAVTQSGDVTVTGTTAINAHAAAVTLANAGNDFQGAVAIATTGAASVGDKDALNLTLTNTGATAVQAGGVLTTTLVNTGATSLAGAGVAVSGSSGALTVASTGATDLGASAVGGNLGITSTGAVTQSGDVTVTGTTTVNANAAAVTLANAGNDFRSAVAVTTTAAARVRNAGSLAVSFNDTGSATAQAGGTLSATLANSGATSLTGAGVTSSGSSGALSIASSGTAGLGASAVNGSLDIASTGAVTQSGDVTVSGATTLNAGASAVTLANAGNDFRGAVTVATTGAASVRDANDLGVSFNGTAATAAQAGGALEARLTGTGASSLTSAGSTTLTAVSASSLLVNSGGAVTQSGALDVPVLELQGAGAVALLNVANAVGKLAVGAGDGTIRFVNGGALSVDTVGATSGITRNADVLLRTESGNLSIAQPIQVGSHALRLTAANGAVSQAGTGAITAGGLAVSATGTIALDAATNALSGPLSAVAGDAIGLKSSTGYTVSGFAADSVAAPAWAAQDGLTATGKVVTLDTASGTVRQDAGKNLVAGSLVLKGSGAVTLENADNDVAKIAVARGDAAADGAISYRDKDGFDITAVGAVDGVTRAGKVTLGNSAGTAVFEGLNTSAPLVQVNGGSITVASPTLTDGKVSVPVFSLGGDIKVNQGAVTLAVNKPAAVDDGLLSTYQQSIGIAKEVVLKDALGKQIRVLADVIVQTSGSLAVAAQGRLNLVADAGGSASLMQAGNQFVGGLSAKLASVPAAATSSDAPARSLLRVTGKQVNVTGAGVEADMAFFNADALGTTDPAVIKARLSYSNTLGTNVQLPGLAISIGSTAFDGGGAPFGQVAVDIGRGDAAGTTAGINSGYITVLPKVGGDPTGTAALIRNKAVILLTGPETGSAGYLFFYDGAGKESAILVKYNGYAPSSPQADGALSSIASVSEAARRDRFEEAVRTENVASRLRGGVITEVGPGRPATEGSSGTQPPRSCAPVGAQLGCAAGDAGGDGKP